MQSEDCRRDDLERLANALAHHRGGAFGRSFQLVNGAKPPPQPRLDAMVTQKLARIA